MGSSSFTLCRKASSNKVQEVGARRGVGHSMAILMALDGVDRFGVPQGMPEERDLTMIEAIHGAKTRLGLSHFPLFSLGIAMKVVEGLCDYTEMVKYKVGGVSTVGLGEQEGAGVLCGRLSKETRYRKILGVAIVIT